MNKKFNVLTGLLLMLTLTVFAQEEKIKVACIGNSITYGSGIRNRDKDSYPMVLGQMLNHEYEVRNYGISARTMLSKGDHPYMKEPAFQEALDYRPNIVIIKLGTNDSKPHNWKHKSQYAKDMQTMITAFRKLPSTPEIYLCYPAKVYGGVQWGINDSIIVNDIIPLIKRVAQKNKIKIIDLHEATSNMPENFPDKVHPNENGAAVIAETVYKAITGKDK